MQRLAVLLSKTHLQLVSLFAAAVTFIGLIITIMSYQSDKRIKRT
ncbi:hypothetical protein V7274_09280 [Bacillus pumilus]|nr:hypothetical protein [Bacillus pumilus]MCW4682023.1 hypothetical protein [Bacillus pumilus]MEC3761797.1 hypothetical protein [Bacillus pumilus]MED1108806.1 hypothetical protein [Bacillus pumilus]WHX44661.1 hypothetical protein QNH35_18485 [Bacillus pumilus]